MYITYRYGSCQFLIIDSSVLRQVAKSIIIAPGWNEETANPIVLVHGKYSSMWLAYRLTVSLGVFGSGKRYISDQELANTSIILTMTLVI